MWYVRARILVLRSPISSESLECGDLILESKEDGQSQYLDVSDTAFMQVLLNLSYEYEEAKRKEVGLMKAAARKAATVEIGAK
jgi:hypothetical protein